MKTLWKTLLLAVADYHSDIIVGASEQYHSVADMCVRETVESVEHNAVVVNIGNAGEMHDS